MTVLIDTNVILDDILNRASNAEAARKINQLVIDMKIDAYITANCLTDIFYIVSKNRDESIARKTIRGLLLSFMVIGVDGDDCLKAIDLPTNDFEDALVVVCADKARLDYIITNDKGFLAESHLGVRSISPAEFLLMYADRS